MDIKRGDNVKMITGKDRSKTGKVSAVMPSADKVVVEGLNLIKRHLRARKEGQKGQILSKPNPVSVSNVMLVCPKCGKPTRVGHKTVGESKVRVCKKCGSEI